MDRQNAFREQEMNMGIKVKKILTGTALIMSLCMFTACGNANKAADEADTNEENMTDNNAANDDNMENNAGENNTNGNSTSGNNAADNNVNNGGTVTDNGTAAEDEAAENETKLTKDMTVILSPIILKDGNDCGFCWGDTYLVTVEGGRCLTEDGKSLKIIKSVEG